MSSSAGPATQIATSVRVHPVASLNPYQGNWTIKVRVTSKGPMRHYNNARGEGCVFNVELTDNDGTQIQATMFNDGARKFFDAFHMGKVYYISNGYVKLANKVYKTVDNDYEITLNGKSKVEEAVNEPTIIPKTQFTFVPLDQLGPYVHQRELIDVIGVVQHVSSTMSIRRKVNNEIVPKRDITIVDDSIKSVVVSLWGPLATGVGKKLLDMFDTSPIVAVKSLRVTDFGGVSLSTVTKTIIEIDPIILESEKLKTWYASEGRCTNFQSVGFGFSPSVKTNATSMFSDRKTLAHITSNHALGEDRTVYYTTLACISLFRSDQTMYYPACKACNKKVTVDEDSGYSCLSCKAWVSVFGDDAERIIGCPAADLHEMKSKDDELAYQTQLKKAAWIPHLLLLMVAPQEYKNEKRQRITVKSVSPVDFAAETKLLLADISSTQS